MTEMEGIIRIQTRTQGSETIFKSRGTIIPHDDGFLVRYMQDRDPTELEILPSGLEMRRFGEIELSCNFLEGRSTQMHMHFSGGSGVIPVFTHNFSFVLSDGNIFALLCYELLLPDDPQKFELNFTIERISEES